MGGRQPITMFQNGLSPEQNSRLLDTIRKMKAHEVHSLVQLVDDTVPRTNKTDSIRAIEVFLHDQEKTKRVVQLVNQLKENGTFGHLDMSRRGQNSQPPRAHPYQIPPRPFNNVVFGQQQQHHVAPMVQSYHPQQMHMMQQQQHASRPQAPQAAQQFPIVPLPFYDVIQTIVQPLELSAIPNGQKLNQKQNFTFQLTSEQYSKLNYRQETTVLPRYEIQLRFFNITEVTGPQKDEFPLNCYVRVNETPVQLPNVIPTNKPNAEPKRPSRPVNITPQVRFSPNGTRVFVEWMGDKRTWACGVYFVYRVNSDILYKRVEENPQKHRMVEETRKQIVNQLTGNGDDDIAMDHHNISLLDPLVKVRMKTPSRCVDCTHLQCFDLCSYLMMNEKKPTWNCPVCSGYCPYDRLIVDDYFREMLGRVDKNTTEVELKQDGSYDIVREDDIATISDDDDDVKPVPSGPSSSSNGVVAQDGGKKKKPVVDDDIIVLSDDDEDLCRGSAKSSPPSIRTPTRPAPVAQVKKTSGSSNDNIEIITLDDTPPRPVQQLQTQRSVQPQQTAQQAPPMRQLSQPTSNTVNINEALAQIGGDVPTSSNNRQPPVSSQPPAPHLQQQPPAPFQMQHVPPQYGYAPQMMHHQPFQNGLIGRSNQMAPMQPPQNQQQMLPPAFYGMNPTGYFNPPIPQMNTYGHSQPQAQNFPYHQN